MDFQNDVRRLAVLQSFYKLLGTQLSTKTDSVRSGLDKKLLEMSEEMGVDRIRVKVNGVEIGTYSVTKHTPTQTVQIVDKEKYYLWAEKHGYMKMEPVYADPIDAMEREGTGELPDGCAVVEYQKPDSTILRVSTSAVEEALGNELPQTLAAALTGQPLPPLLGDGQ